MTTPAEFPEQRYEDPVRHYEGNGIIVHWEPKLCIHVANCVRGLPGVFKPNDRPWIDASQADAEALAETIRSCPSGALAYERTEGGPQEEPAEPMEVTPRSNGPYFLRGDFDLIDADGSKLRHGYRVALCRCGASENKPYCDNSHRRVDFRT